MRGKGESSLSLYRDWQMFFAPRLHEFHRSLFQGFFDACRGPVANDSPEAQDVTSEAARALIALQYFEFPEHRLFHL